MSAALVDFMAKARNAVPSGADEHAKRLRVDVNSEVVAEALGEKNFGFFGKRNRLFVLNISLGHCHIVVVITHRARCEHSISPCFRTHPAATLTLRQEAA